MWWQWPASASALQPQREHLRSGANLLARCSRPATPVANPECVSASVPERSPHTMQATSSTAARSAWPLLSRAARAMAWWRGGPRRRPPSTRSAADLTSFHHGGTCMSPGTSQEHSSALERLSFSQVSVSRSSSPRRALGRRGRFNQSAVGMRSLLLSPVTQCRQEDVPPVVSPLWTSRSILQPTRLNRRLPQNIRAPVALRMRSLNEGWEVCPAASSWRVPPRNTVVHAAPGG